MAISRPNILRIITLVISIVPIGPVILAYQQHMIPITHVSIHFILGIIGIFAAINVKSARLYCQVVSIFFILLFIFGLLAKGNTFFIHFNFGIPDDIAHIIFAAFIFYFGFIFKLTKA